MTPQKVKRGRNAKAERGKRRKIGEPITYAPCRVAMPCGLSLTALRPAELTSTSSFPRWLIRKKKKEGRREKKKEKEREKKRIMNMHRADPATTVCRHFAPGCEGPGSLRSSCTVNRALDHSMPMQLYLEPAVVATHLPRGIV